jgi:Tfp pilus assembly protein PilV
VRLRSKSRGFTTIELLIASIVALVVVFAMGNLILQNQRSWEWGRDKTVLQQNTTEALERMARSVRAARKLAVVSDTKFSTYDENGVLVHSYERVLVGGEGRLQEDAADLVDRQCTQFQVTTDEDTTSVNLVLELEDEAGNRVAASTRATVRNLTYEF